MYINQCLTLDVLHYKLSVCFTLHLLRRLATGRWFSPRPPVSSANKTDRHNITEILLKVALNTIKKIRCISKTRVYRVTLVFLGMLVIKKRRYQI